MSLNRRTFFGWVAAAFADIRGTVFARSPMTATPKYTVATSVPAFQKKLKADFSRNQADFAVNRYCHLVPVENPVGIWYQMADGETINELAYLCHRSSFESSAIPQVGLEGLLAQKAMSLRASKVGKLLSGNHPWNPSHVVDFESSEKPFPRTGNWAQSTSARCDVQKSIVFADVEIVKSTRHAEIYGEYVLVMNPHTASQLSLSQELREFVKEQSSKANDNYGLPEFLYGKRIVVEDTVTVAVKDGTVESKFTIPNGTVAMLYRDLRPEGIEMARTYATISLHVVKADEMNVERWDGKTAVADNVHVAMTCPATGFLFLNVC